MKETLFNQLQQQEKLVFGENNLPISSNIKNHLIPVADKLLGRIPAYMPEYTLHSIQHCETILDNIRKILPDDVELNVVELTILIQAVYLHDIGMVINRDEAEQIKKSPDFKKLFIEFDKDTEEDEILTEYIRRNHVNKSIEYIDQFKNDFSTYKIDFTFKEIDLSLWVKNVILSHAYPVDFLKDQDRFPTKKLIHGDYVNIQFLGLLLRLGDILDFDIFRTPPFLYKHINPQNKISIGEWQKHQAIEGARFTPNEIIFEASCKSARVERAVREFVRWIEDERRNTMDLVNSNNHTYKLQLKDEIKFNCRNDGSYIYNDLELQLDYEKVLNILMGTELYDSPDIFIREILQNAYDACKCRADMYAKNSEEYNPRISIKYSSIDSILEIEDNGIGIDEEVFQNYLIKIGRSYYKSKSFQSQEYEFSPISNFGIGIISCFMVSDSIEIESLKCYSPTESAKPINFILNVNNRYIEQRAKNKKSFGTIIRLNLKHDYSEKLLEKSIVKIIEENMNYQEIPVEVEIDKKVHTLDNKKIVIPDDYKDISGVLIFELNDNQWVEGFVVVFQSQHQSIIGGSKISQQCFCISSKNNTINFKPGWLRNCSFVLNILPSKKLKLKASRSKVYEDENFRALKSFLIEYLVTQFNKLDDKVVTHFLGDGRGNIFSGSVIEYQFLISKIYFTFLKPAKALNFKDASNRLRGKKVAVIHQDYLQNSTVQKKLEFLFRKYDFVLLQHQLDFFYQFSEPYIVDRKLIVTNLSGLLYYELTFSHDFKLDIKDYDFKYTWNRRFPIVYLGDKESLFCVVGNRQYNSVDLQINDNHRLGKLLKDTEKTSYTKRFVGSFRTNIAVALERGIHLTEYLNFDGEHHFLLSNNAAAYSLKTIGLINPNFIKTLNYVLRENLLLPLQKDSILEKENLDEFLLSEKDFPEWWLNK